MSVRWKLRERKGWEGEKAVKGKGGRGKEANRKNLKTDVEGEKQKDKKETGERYDKRYPAGNRVGYSLMSYPGREERTEMKINIKNT